MAENTAAAVKTVEAEEEELLRRQLHINRRYVGTKETIAYILYDISASFSVDKYNDLYITNIAKIALNFQAVVTAIIGVWDVINDTFTGALVDKTRTRWGKFKPYLVLYAGPGMLMTCIYWMMPVFFPGSGEWLRSKLVFYLVLLVFKNLAESLRNIARTGMLATITPDVRDRTRLITQANLLSGFVEKGPELIMGLMIDLVNHNVVKISMPSLYVGFGVITSAVAGAFALYFSLIAAERVMQTVDRPSIKQGIISIINNKPVLLITLSEFLSAFSISSGSNFYYVDVLGAASISTIVGIPGAVVSPVSYSYVPWARSKFSTKALWIVGSHFNNLLMVIVFLIGSIGGKVNGLYKKKSVMIPVLTIYETLFMTIYGLRKVIPSEMLNEAMDYCEWKNGYRTEGMTGVAKGIAVKLVQTLGGTIKNFILSAIGYQQGAEFNTQSDDTKYKIFVMFSILPVVTGIFGIIPKLFYDLGGAKRDKMYAELRARRAEMSKNVIGEEGDATSAV